MAKPKPKRVLITGGPVHAHLDSVKIITNRFKGGRMSALAGDLARLGADVTYLYAPAAGAEAPSFPGITLVKHSGFNHYREQVLELAPTMDGVVLGAAVANLIPAKPWEGKFPSHNFRPGDLVQIPFHVAPRVIDLVKRVAPATQLFGFKLLDGVEREELVRAAYGIVLDARATAVIANDAKSLDQKFIVTKERAIHPLNHLDLAEWLWEMLHDEYYITFASFTGSVHDMEDAEGRVRELIHRHKDKFTRVEGGLVFGTVAVRCGKGFMTTGRGKKELDEFAYVTRVDHKKRRVYAKDGVKASLNSPLLATLFENAQVDHIVHYHEQVDGLPTAPYAPPGTVRDSMHRPHGTSFNIEAHGCMLLFDKEGRRL